MSFQSEVATPCDGAFLSFPQTSYYAGGMGAVVVQNLETLDGTGNRAPGLCAGLSAAFLIVMKNLLQKANDMTMVNMVKAFKDYACSADGAAVIGTVQKDVDAAVGEVAAEVAIAEFFKAGIGFRSLKHAATVAGDSVKNNDFSNFVASALGYDILTFGSSTGLGHTIAAINLNVVGKKPQIVVYDPNAGFTQLSDDPQNQMAKFATYWFASKWGTQFVAQRFIFSRYT